MREHIRKNFDYPKEAQVKGIQGRVNTMFTIDENGEITSLRMRGPDSLLTNEAKRIIDQLPTMKPGNHKGEVVKVAFSVPISFSLNSNSDDRKGQAIKNYDNETDVPFAVVDEVPVFPGCEDTEDKKACFNEMMQKHIGKNFSYPKEAQEKGIQGRVNIMLTVAKNGEIKDMSFRGPDKLLEDEAQRIMEKLPRMKPGKQKGKKVNVLYSIPITFRLESTGIKSPIGLNLDTIKEIQATPLYIIDGKESTKEAFGFIAPKEIESINVRKNESAVNMYGEKGKNGVIEVTTKKDEDIDVPYTKEVVDMTFAVVDEAPIFPGCENADDKKICFNQMMQKHINQHFKYPKDAQENKIQGKVEIMFTVSQNGSINNVRLDGPDKLLEYEAARIISFLPKMKPGKQKGKNVNVIYSIPITFKLD